MSPMASLWKSFTDKLKIIYLTRVSVSYSLCVMSLHLCACHSSRVMMWTRLLLVLYCLREQQWWIVVTKVFNCFNWKCPHCRKCIHKSSVYMTLLPNMGIIYIINIILPYLVIIMCRGIPGGEENGKKGYMLTFVIAYIRVRMRVIIIVYTDIWSWHIMFLVSQW